MTPKRVVVSQKITKLNKQTYEQMVKSLWMRVYHWFARMLTAYILSWQLGLFSAIFYINKFHKHTKTTH